MEDVSKTYAKFINNITLHLINGTINENEFNISLPFTNQFILKMERDMQDSSKDMIVYKIVGGNLALSNNGGNARFEFRRILIQMKLLLHYKNMNRRYLGLFISLHS